MEKIILASGSPRRRAILKQLHFPFRVIVPSVREEEFTAAEPAALARILAEQKVAKVAAGLKKQQCRWILGVDTLVTLEGHIFGKPDNRREAAAMLRTLAGKSHQVISGVALLPAAGRQVCSRVVTSEVKFKELSTAELNFYLDTNEWQGVAGAYRIQERAAFYIEWIKGSYSNIVGLPISQFYGMLLENNYIF